MRIYNGTDSQVNLPLFGTHRITIAPHSISGDVMGSIDFVKLVTSSYQPEELLIVVSGPYELNMCASLPYASEHVVQTLEEAILRTTKKEPEVVNEPEAVVEKSEVEEETKEDATETADLDVVSSKKTKKK